MKIKKNIIALLTATIMLICFCACTNGSGDGASETQPDARPDTEESAQAPADIRSESESETETITDMIGREVRVTPGSYKRVVCVGAGALRLFSYIGDISLLCGVEDIDNMSLSERPKMFDSVARPYMTAFGEELKTLPSCGVGGPNAQTAEAEKILSCNPDIVISGYTDIEKASALEQQLGIPVVTVRVGKRGVFDDAFRDGVAMLSRIFGEEEKAAALIAFVESEAFEIASRTKHIQDSDKPSAYICGLGNWGTTNHLMTSQSYVSFELANVENVINDLKAPGIQPIEQEKFIELGKDMDIMIIDAAAVKNIVPLYAEDSTMFDTCKAWQNGEVYLQMPFNAYYTNYEIELLNTWFIAKTVYPDLFDDIDMTEKANEITEMFLGESLAEDIFAYPSSFGGYGKIDTESFFAG